MASFHVKDGPDDSSCFSFHFFETGLRRYDRTVAGGPAGIKSVMTVLANLQQNT